MISVNTAYHVLTDFMVQLARFLLRLVAVLLVVAEIVQKSWFRGLPARPMRIHIKFPRRIVFDQKIGAQPTNEPAGSQSLPTVFKTASSSFSLCHSSSPLLFIVLVLSLVQRAILLKLFLLLALLLWLVVLLLQLLMVPAVDCCDCWMIVIVGSTTWDV